MSIFHMGYDKNYLKLSRGLFFDPFFITSTRCFADRDSLKLKFSNDSPPASLLKNLTCKLYRHSVTEWLQNDIFINQWDHGYRINTSDEPLHRDPENAIWNIHCENSSSRWLQNVVIIIPIGTHCTITNSFCQSQIYFFFIKY
jgi:hypothetical protein